MKLKIDIPNIIEDITLSQYKHFLKLQETKMMIDLCTLK
jgi:hypothetical protein